MTKIIQVSKPDNETLYVYRINGVCTVILNHTLEFNAQIVECVWSGTGLNNAVDHAQRGGYYLSSVSDVEVMDDCLVYYAVGGCGAGDFVSNVRSVMDEGQHAIVVWGSQPMHVIKSNGCVSSRFTPSYHFFSEKFNELGKR